MPFPGDWGPVPIWRSKNRGKDRLPENKEVDEFSPLPTGIYIPRDGAEEQEQLSKANPMPILSMAPTLLGGVPLGADFAWKLALDGRVFVASDADQNDRVTGQTSFADTTPTFLLHNPATSGIVCVPFYYQLVQTGTVAGGDIGIETEVRSPSAYASSGTSEGVSSAFFGRANVPGFSAAPVNLCLLYSGATASSGAGRVMGHATLAADVSPAEGVINVYEWTAPSGLLLGPNSSLGVYTYAATTGPTWGWHFGWAELPASMLL